MFVVVHPIDSIPVTVVHVIDIIAAVADRHVTRIGTCWCRSSSVTSCSCGWGSGNSAGPTCRARGSPTRKVTTNPTTPAAPMISRSHRAWNKVRKQAADEAAVPIAIAASRVVQKRFVDFYDEIATTATMSTTRSSPPCASPR